MYDMNKGDFDKMRQLFNDFDGESMTHVESRKEADPSGSEYGQLYSQGKM